jgi:hypothetical protein
LGDVDATVALADPIDLAEAERIGKPRCCCVGIAVVQMRQDGVGGHGSVSHHHAIIDENPKMVIRPADLATLIARRDRLDAAWPRGAAL